MTSQDLSGNSNFDVLARYLKEKKDRKSVEFEALSERKKKEMLHHDLQRTTRVQQDLPKDVFEKLHGNKKYYSTIARSREYWESWITNHVKDKVFVDYACGNGDRAVSAAVQGAKLVIGIDLSEVSLENGRRMAQQAGVSDRCHFLQVDCENTGLPDNSVDVVLCSGVLHHLDLSYAFPEIRRILKPGGIALAIEALDYNPIIKMYRMLTPEMRTEWEKNHILSMKDVYFAERFFEIGEVRFWHLFSILGVVFRKSDFMLKAALRVLNALDGIVLRIPILQRMAWMFTFELIKRPEN